MAAIQKSMKTMGKAMTQISEIADFGDKLFEEQLHAQLCWVRCTHCSDYEAWGASGNYKAWGASGNYEARGESGNYKARGASGDYEAWGASGGKYEAQMVIFCILAASIICSAIIVR